MGTLSNSRWNRSLSNQSRLPWSLIEAGQSEIKSIWATPAVRRRARQRWVISLPDSERQVEFLCWSATRPKFSVVPQPAQTPCFAWGKPEQLSNEECQNLENSQHRHVLCAYRVPLTIKERLDDKNALDLGPFRYVIKMAVRDADGGELDPIGAWVTGMVRGEVTVITPQEKDKVEANSGYISLGYFPAKEGTPKDRVSSWNRHSSICSSCAMKKRRPSLWR